MQREVDEWDIFEQPDAKVCGCQICKSTEEAERRCAHEELRRSCLGRRGFRL